MKESTYKGIGFPALLGLLFIALKLTGYINWSWLWILSPFWLLPCIIIIGILLYTIFDFLFS
jgi:hypothetical protein